MANKLTIEVVISDKGTAKIVQKGIEGVGKAAEGTTKKTREASKAQDEYNYKLNQGVTGASSAARSFSKLNQAIGQGNNGLVGAYATLAANAFAVSAAFTTMRDAVQAEMVMKGLEVQGARLGITLTNTAKRVEELARGQLSLADAAAAAAQASAVGFDTKSIEEITKAAQNASIALGRNMTDSMDRLIKGTSKLEPELLDELGIMVKLEEAKNKYALATGKSAASLTSFEQRQAFLNAALEESRLKFGGLSDQVDPDPYSKLAAAFANLTKDTLNFINNSTGLKEFISFLSENTTALISVIVMFAGTISRQLVPSLYEVTEQTKAAQAAIARKIQTQKEQINVTLKQAAAEKKAAASSAIEKVSVAQSPKAVKDYIAALQQNNVVDKQREAALRSLNGAIAGHTGALKKITDQESEAYKEKDNLIKALKVQKTELTTLTAAQLAHDSAVSTSEQKLSNLRRQSIGLRLQNVAVSQRANAIEAAGELNLETFRRSGIRSVEAYRRGITQVAASKVQAAASSNSFARGIAFVSASTVGARTAIFGLSLAVRGLGAAFLNLIPVIGQVLFVGSLLLEFGGMAWDWMFPPPEGQEALDKAKESFEEIIKRVDETAKRTSTLFADKGKSAGVAAEAYLALSNTIGEVSTALNEVETAQKQLGVSEATKTAKLLESAFKSRSVDLSEDVIDSEAFKSVNSLAKLGYEPLNKAILDATVNSKEFQNASDEKQIEILSKSLKELEKRYGSVGQSVADLRSSYKTLEETTSKFIESSTPSTPYDGLVDSLTATRISVANLEAELIKGAITAEDFNRQILELGPKSVGLLDSATQKQIRSLQQLDAQVKASEKSLAELGKGVNLGAYKSQEEALKNLKEQQVRLQKEVTATSIDALKVSQQRLLQLQKESIVMDGQLKLEQQRFSTTKNILSSTGAGYEVLIRQEEKIRNMQVAKIKAEQAINQQLNIQNEIRLNQAILEKQALDLRIQNLKAGKEDLGILTQILDKFKEFGQLVFGSNSWTQTSTQELQAQSKILEESIIGLDAEAAKLGNAIAAADFAASAILAENLTEGQKAAEKLKIDFESIQSLSEKIRSSEQEVLSYEERRLNIANSLTISSLRDLRVASAKYEAEERASKLALDTAKDKLAIDIRAANEALAREGAETAAGKAIAGKIKLLEEEVRITQETFNIKQQILKANLAIELTERFRIDTLGNGLEIQQNALSLLQREFDLKSGLLQQERDIAAARLRVLAGPNLNPKTERALEAKALADEYKLAVQQFGLKMAAIDAEYALLEAQRLQLEFNLKAQRAFLEQQARADGNVSDTERRGLDQISNAIGMIGAVDYSTMKDLAKETERNSLELLKTRALEARGPAGGLFGGLSGAVLQGVAIFGNLNSASRSLEEAKKPVDNLVKAVLPDFSKATIDAKNSLNSFEEQIKSLDLNIPELKTRLDQIVETFNEFLNKLKKEGSLVSEAANMGQIAGSGPKEVAKSLFDYTKKAFPDLRVDEFGVSEGHTPGSMHYDSRAFDVNVPGSGKEVNNPAHKARLDQVAKDLSSKGVEVLWNGWIWRAGAQVAKIRSKDKHYDHLHAEIDGASYEVIKKLMQTTTAAVSSGAQRAVESAADNDNPAIEVVSSLSRHPTVDRTAKAYTSFDAPEKATDSAKFSVGSLLEAATPSLEYFIEQFSSLGPQGEVMSSVLSGFLSFGEQLNTTFTVLGMSTQELSKSVGKDLKESEASLLRISAGFDAAGAAIGAINQILQASSNAKIAGIDREIAAEQKRDGKSAASVAKLEAMEKKKDSVARKAFNTNKKLMMAQAVMSTAAAIASTLATAPDPITKIVMAGIIGAMGAAQIAVIAGTQYQSTSSSANASSMPSTLSIGRRGDSVDLARGPNANAGGEAGFLRGSQGFGTNASNFRTIGSAYGGDLMRGYGNTGFVVGEKGPEVITPETPIKVTPANDTMASPSVNATINIQALDSSDVQRILVDQKGNIIQMLRDAANASGQGFMEDVNVNVFTRPGVNKL
jgi:hypothetical protein